MRSILLLALVPACVATSYTFSPTARGITPREASCEFSIIAATPDEPFEEVGTMKHYNGDIPTTEAAFRKAIASTVCDNGGHAVVATPTNKNYESATMIRYSKDFHQ